MSFAFAFGRLFGVQVILLLPLFELDQHTC